MLKRSLLVFILLAGSSAYADICEDYPPVGAKAEFTYTGTYNNGAWGYAIDIPAGLVGGLYQDPNAPQHGIQVILSWEPRSTVYFSGEANSLENDKDKPLNSQEYSSYQISVIKKYAHVLTSSVKKAKLGSYDGYSWMVKYRCPKGNVVRVTEGIAAIPSGRGLVYEVVLETTEARHKTDHDVLNQFIRSFRLTD